MVSKTFRNLIIKVVPRYIILTSYEGLFGLRKSTNAQNNEVLLPFKQRRGVLKETCESLAVFFLIVYECKFCFITLDSL